MNNNSPTDRISSFQTIMFMTNYLLGTGIVVVPRIVTEKVKTPDSWISLILGGVICILITLLHVRLCQRYPNETFFQFNQKIVGKWIGLFLSLIVIVFYIVGSAFEVRNLVETMGIYLLQGTPTWAIMIPFIWIGLYLVLGGGINSLARMLEIIFPITAICILVVIFLGIGIFEIDNLRPVLGMGVKPISKGIMTASTSFSGFEIILFIFMFMKDKKQAPKVVIIGLGVPIFFYTMTTILVVGALSVDGVLFQTWPVLTYIRGYEIPGLFFERFDSLFIVIWIMQIFTTYAIALYVAALGMAQIFKKRCIRPFLFGIIPFIYTIANMPKNINETIKWEGTFLFIYFLFFCIFPILLLIISFVRGNIDAKI
ncbi:spore gernimation protein [Bacillus sp. FJAT-25509]|uniref:GerAB/ArcD/ProY family transporter n=1 Tax=Bacillus sp. FJAT-25509 TaxID=1712029 RepID=UPI0006F3C010|nr:GerAB/ArcD/ProY family transporter [Bacillus sp. FJAT-25509]KQL38252.1 spore gernimation protein [Bacillus sp. FJAT-25509]